jgi:hypothetical protein
MRNPAYEVEGKQYLIGAAGTTFVAFALPQIIDTRVHSSTDTIWGWRVWAVVYRLRLIPRFGTPS